MYSKFGVEISSTVFELCSGNYAGRTDARTHGTHLNLNKNIIKYKKSLFWILSNPQYDTLYLYITIDNC